MKDINLRQDAPSQVSQVNPTKISEEISKLTSYSARNSSTKKMK